ncbi:PREDICTED: lipopolysaccharide-induced tumor necrosis factor-alpha factor homolog [Branchiostoma belcheri]|uniref:Lipopolysaccharide-induced tumor necrosis factor-alpha factor homolog n=1 Tax=Branchiostoma belcheri TaxID=7741 RepID=A0A6P4ZFD3_BRABE|nr:PREDICTED: lipopolysaccharide-induced tumor necrosis factor-alpha factor homolog [Branchiostoma belcheri]
MTEKVDMAPPPYPGQDPGQSGAQIPGQPVGYEPQPGQPAGEYVQPPGQPMVYPGMGPPVPPGATVFVRQVPVIPPDHPTRSKDPVRMTCPTCQQNIETTITREIGLFTWLAVGFIFLMGFALPLFWLGCCFIPMCIPSCKDTRHTCPNCDTHLGTYQIAK